MTEWEERNEDRSLRGGNDKYDGRFSNGGWLGGFARVRVFSLSLFSSCSCCSLFAKLEHWEISFASITEAVLAVGSSVRPPISIPQTLELPLRRREEKGESAALRA